jgi:hydroperoxide lyase
MQAKNFAMNILKQSSSIWVPELIANLDIFFDQIEATLSKSSSAGYFSPLQQFLFTFLSKVLARADPSLDPKIDESGSSMLNKWLAVQLLPTISIGTIQPLEEIFLHSFSYPYALVSGDYNNLYNFIKQHGNVMYMLAIAYCEKKIA